MFVHLIVAASPFNLTLDGHGPSSNHNNLMQNQPKFWNSSEISQKMVILITQRFHRCHKDLPGWRSEILRIDWIHLGVESKLADKFRQEWSKMQDWGILIVRSSLSYASDSGLRKCYRPCFSQLVVDVVALVVATAQRSGGLFFRNYSGTWRDQSRCHYLAVKIGREHCTRSNTHA